MAYDRFDGDLLIPEVEVDHSVTGAPNCSVRKQDVTGQSADLGPKNAVRLLAVLEHTAPPLQPTIENKNKLCPKWPRVAVCSTGSKTAALEHSPLLCGPLLLNVVSSLRPSLQWASHQRCRETHRPRARGHSPANDPSAIL